MSYSSLHRHASMVFDEVRNSAYLEAMRRVITPESIVLDLGAGVGVLGLLAAKLGARKVYCVEPSPVAEHIRTLAKANGVEDRIEVVRSRIETAELPEQVDVLLSVFTGNLLFTENLMPSLYYARDRYLKPGGKMIPDRARLRFAGIQAPDLHADKVGRFRSSSLGIDYSVLAGIVANREFVSSRGAAAPVPMTSSETAIDLDLHTATEERIKWAAKSVALRDGVLDGLVGWIEIRLGEAWLSTAPDAPDVHWSPVVLPVMAPILVGRGQVVDMAFQFVDDGHLIWSLGIDGASQRQSTLLGNPDAAIDVMLSSDSCKNPVGDEGLLLERVLAAMRLGKSNIEIAAEIAAVMPHRFRHRNDALKRVRSLSARYRSHPARKE